MESQSQVALCEGQPVAIKSDLNDRCISLVQKRINLRKIKVVFI